MNSLNNKLNDEYMDYLFDCILSLKNKEECYRYFEDLCTIAELKAMSQRMHVAKMLTEQRVYNDIVKLTGASTATISRVNRCLSYGTNGYKLAIERLKEQHE
ncbi:TrpR family protein YerC/YecD [[Clostridium] methylpentosum DSM 5476]|uniref:TrpR family protein YerC/YecD n=1 Tax=[Clostridium] methylpentosum DSM 5476 TaxID=537013 RepID=C0EJ60_9FIRM|nr:TrpR family protein YerC/YecD [[Clostridium] methylpentosum DSM 5476]